MNERGKKGVFHRLNWWLEALGGFFYPSVCQYCRAEPAEATEGYVGAACRRRVRYVQPPFCARCGLPYEGTISRSFECSNCRALELHFDWARSVAPATGVLLEIVHRYKYGRERWFEPFLGGLLAATAGPQLRGRGWDLIVPVPLHPIKERDREFNQARYLSVCLGRAAGIPVRGRVLRRRSFTKTQTRLSRISRQQNVRGAFVPRAGLFLEGQRVILVDDVLTTGATTSECARVLKASGVAEVGVWTVARGV